MKLTFQLAGPAGDTALLVTTPVPPEERAAIAQRLLAIGELQPKAVAFLAAPTGRGVLRLETAGGELNGSAMLQAAMAFAVGRGIRREKKFSLEVDGCEDLFTVHANPLTGQVTAEHPLPLAMEKHPFLDQDVPVVQFPGMAYAILKGGELPAEDVLLPALQTLAEGLDTPAAGAIAWDFRGTSLRAACSLRAADTLRYPQVCATAAAAVAAWQSRDGRDGTQKLSLQQPGGTLHIAASARQGRLRRLTVSGPVVLGPVYNLEF